MEESKLPMAEARAAYELALAKVAGADAMVLDKLERDRAEMLHRLLAAPVEPECKLAVSETEAKRAGRAAAAKRRRAEKKKEDDAVAQETWRRLRRRSSRQQWWRCQRPSVSGCMRAGCAVSRMLRRTWTTAAASWQVHA